MPVQENYKYADDSHEKTRITGDFRYGCHSEKTGRRKRSDVAVSLQQDGWNLDGTRNTVERKSNWLVNKCGHNLRTTDPACTGCFNRHEGE